MKKVLALICLSFVGCQSKQEHAEQMVKAYLLKTINDPDSYQSISFTKLHKPNDTIVFGIDKKPIKIEYNGCYQLEHTYRDKNTYGGVMPTVVSTHTLIFRFDSTVSKFPNGFKQHIDRDKIQTWRLQ